MGLFSRALVDRHAVEWVFDGVEWLIDAYADAPLGSGSERSRIFFRLPVPADFPAAPDGVPLGEHLGCTVMTQLDFPPDGPVRLVAEEVRDAADLGGLATVTGDGRTACGQYEAIPREDGSLDEIITYSEGASAVQHVATFAHELSHALHLRAPDLPPAFDEGREMVELFTDLTAIFFGYGVFLANSRFEFAAFSEPDRQGWQARGAGYLPEREMVFATALMAELGGVESDIYAPHLKPRLAKLVPLARKQLARHAERVDALRRRVPPDPPLPGD